MVFVALALAALSAAAAAPGPAVWSTNEAGLSWLSALERNEGVLRELRGLAEADAAEPATSAFAPNFSNDHFTQDPGDWTAVALMNRGVLLADGCAAAPLTCSVLTTLSPHLQPRPPHATEVGVRFLKLAPGAALREHRGPGGRLVAHLGVSIPDSVS